MAIIADEDTTSVTNSATLLFDAGTTAGIYQLYADLDNLVNGDQFEFWAEMAVLSGGTDKRILGGTYANDMGASSIIVFPPLSNQYGLAFYGQRIAGSNRNIPWRVDQIDG